MKTTKKTIYVLTLLLIFSSMHSYAQQQDENSIISDVRSFSQQGKNLIINIDFNLDKLNIKSREQVIIRPVIRTHSNLLELPPLVVNGKIRHKVYLRQKAFGKIKDSNSNDIEIKKKKNGTVQSIPYSISIAYEEWMSTAGLYIQQSNCAGCGKSPNTISEYLLASSPILASASKYIPKPLVSFVIPAEEKIKARENKGTAYLKYPSGQSSINSHFKNNKEELDKIHSVMDKLVNNKHLIITNIKITGLASIEGTYDLNMRLSKNRAKGLESYLIKKYQLPDSLFNTNWVGEDWDGLTKLIENSDMVEKGRILQIIHSIGIFDGREKQLMLLDNGKPYRYMLDTYFPLLRKADYTVEYTLDNFSNQNIDEIFKTHPEYLSQRELFMLAEKNDRMSDKFKEIIDMTVSLYPKDYTANLNASASYILRGDYEKALRFALLAGNSGEALNNMGIIYIMQGKNEDAKATLTKAKQLGSLDAEHNLKELEKIGHTQASEI